MATKKVLSNSEKFSRLTFIRYVDKDKWGAQRGLFRCDCGNEAVILVGNVRRGASKSCGCLKKEQLSIDKPGLRHGLAKTPIYDAWHLMMRRCYNDRYKSYHQYGGRGIKVCKEWHDVVKFDRWAKENGWELGLQLDRINNNGSYRPGNCRFVTSKQNNSNRRDNYLITYKGETKTLSEWSRVTGMDRKTIYHRIEILDWSIGKALTIKPNSHKNRE